VNDDDDVLAVGHVTCTPQGSSWRIITSEHYGAVREVRLEGCSSEYQQQHHHHHHHHHHHQVEGVTKKDLMEIGLTMGQVAIGTNVFAYFTPIIINHNTKRILNSQYAQAIEFLNIFSQGAPAPPISRGSRERDLERAIADLQLQVAVHVRTN
jgi:hypothetical protein